MRIDRPIFIVAPPRCGTTLLYECLVSHPDVGYFNRANRKFPEHPRFAWWLTRARIVRDSPRESRSIWFRFLGKRGHDLADARDATAHAREWYERIIGSVLRARRATRFASKLPAHSVQLAYLDALFPDALFIQPLRDWRAVVASTVVKRERDYPGVWFGVRLPGWQEAAAREPALGAAWQYRVVHEHLEANAPKYGDRFLRVRYEELVAEPARVMRGIARFAGLRWSEEIEARLPRDIRPVHERWRETLTPELLTKIEREHGESLKRYEFGTSPPLSAAHA